MTTLKYLTISENTRKLNNGRKRAEEIMAIYRLGLYFYLGQNNQVYVFLFYTCW